MRGSFSAVAKSIVSFEKVFNDASAGSSCSSDDTADYGKKYCKKNYDDAYGFCFEARQQCCSSSKKTTSWTSFCEYYGFPTLEETSEGITGHTPWAVNGDFTIDCKCCGGEKC